jgi:hypothetical protein
VLSKDLNLQVTVAAVGALHESVRLIARGHFSGDSYGHGIFAAIYPANQTVYLTGVTDPITDYSHFPVEAGDRVGLTLQGATVEVTLNGTAVYTRTADYVGPGQVAIGAMIETHDPNWGAQRIDNFHVSASARYRAGPLR